ncbi:LacI family DNA-binding transcriptional regulator [Jiangella alkaliphila]|uniref:Transcriptional regulator, LacI family n=1 Tax=Jiangella alkaliphila TaxID=419479 RepID=A0A1H2GVK2_9ACTN|nr:LacI family DNA-binding transcriptional regulator [Jiangella alkaliphila]SDU23529.1 transcriptional regulator, LacI family [Jiangella alkaliphila]
MTTTRVTIAEIAREAGVSEATVSKVLNGRTEVAPATRARVQDLLDARGYERRGTRVEERTGLIDLVISELNTPWSMDVLRGAEQEARRAGAAVVVTSTEGRDDASWLDRVTARRSDGVLLALAPLPAGGARRLTAAGIPFVLVDPVGGFDPAIPTVGVTNWAGALAATEHLIGLGHRRIAAITGPPELVCSQQRVEGYRAALGRAGLPVDDALVRYGDFRPGGGEDQARALLELPDPPTAIFAGSDLQATGVYAEAHRRGLRVPDQLSVVGFDDVALCEWVSPALTTVRQPLLEMARLAIRTVLDPPGTGQPLRIELSTALITRESTAPPPG